MYFKLSYKQYSAIIEAGNKEDAVDSFKATMLLNNIDNNCIDVKELTKEAANNNYTNMFNRTINWREK